MSQAFRERVDDLIVVDTNDETALMEAIVKLAHHVRVDAVLPGFEYFIPLVSRVNAKLQLPGLPLESVDAVRIKSLMRDRLKAISISYWVSNLRRLNAHVEFTPKASATSYVQTRVHKKNIVRKLSPP